MTLVEEGLPCKNKQSSLNYNIFPIISFDLREITSQLASTLLLRLPPKSQSRNGGVLTVTLSTLLSQFRDEQACSSSDDVKKKGKKVSEHMEREEETRAQTHFKNT